MSPSNLKQLEEDRERSGRFGNKKHRVSSLQLDVRRPDPTPEIDAYRSRPGISPQEKARADLAAAAHAVLSEYPEASNVSLISTEADRAAKRQASWDRSQPRGARPSRPPVQMDYRTSDDKQRDSRYIRADVLDEGGNTLGSYNFADASHHDKSALERIRSMQWNPNTLATPYNQAIEDAAEELADHDGPGWKHWLKGFNLEAAADWTPPPVLTPADNTQREAAPEPAAAAPQKAVAPRWWQAGRRR